MERAELTDELLGTFRIAKVFHDNQHHVRSLDFDGTGEFCITGCPEDESMQLYDAIAAKYPSRTPSNRKTIYSKKYGVGLVRFTHRANNVIYSSTKGGDETIRYLSLHDNAYLRYFKGHERRVSALEMSPLTDGFLSAAADDTVRLWDLRSPSCAGVMAVTGEPVVAIDPQGIVFAVGLESKYLRLYDMKSFEKGPFAVFEIIDPARSPPPDWSALTFSPDGRELLVSTRQGLAYVLDSFDGFVKHVLTGPQNSTRLDLQASWTPDARYVLSGSQDGKIWMWRRDTGRPLPSPLEGHLSYPQVVRFNPKNLMMASACTNVAFWLPEL